MIIKAKFGVGGAFFKLVILSLLSLLLLEGCSALSMFSSKEKPKINIAGKRISVLTFDKPLEVSDSMASVTVDVPQPYLNEDWPQTGGYSSHTMYNLKGPARLKKLWSVRVGRGGEIGSRVVMSPIVAEGKVFAMDTDVKVSAFDARSGRGIWRTDLALSVEKPQVGFGGGLAYENNKVFVANGFGDVFALKPDDGSILWRQKLNEAFRTAPTVSGGRIYVTSFNNQLMALDETDGHVIWNYRAISEGAHILSETSPAVAGDAMVAPFSSGELIAFLADNGQVTWQDSLTRTGRFSSISTMNDIAGSPVIDHG
ncbi:MAG TPA: PQQ-binding-like beta-propeller repeat protein, partial [Alphaproteobacteria bacterium]|nr:PQQ-binding-like beta-propeller repeat protein [Alphaproteobacteria bacterium]